MILPSLKSLSLKSILNLFVFSILLYLPHSFAAQYDVTLIDTLGGASTTVAEINNADQILVESQLPSGVYHIAIMENGVLTDLGLAVPSFDGVDSGYFYGFNDLGHVVGMTSSLAENSVNHFYYDGGTVVNLSEILNYAIPADYDSGLTGLNNSGVITAVRHGVFKEAMILTPDGLGGYVTETFGFPDKHNWAMGLNDNGRVYGMTRPDLVSPNSSLAVIYDSGNLYETGTLGGTTSHPYDMNENGDVVGVSQIGPSEFRAFIYQNELMVRLDDLGGSWSSAFGLNDHGVVVGGAYNIDYELRAFMHADGNTVDLNNLIDPNSGWVLEYAWDINNNSLIVGVGSLNGERKSFLLTPINEPPIADNGGPYVGVATVAVQFDGSASIDPEGKPLTYQWDFGDGNVGVGSNPSHAYANSGIYAVSLVVSDGEHDSDAVVTNVTIDNHAPIANAGDDINVLERSTVYLDATSSTDPDGSIVSYQWVKVAGRRVRLSNATSAVASFRAPRVKNPEAVTFELTVTDNENGVSIDTVTITILPK